MWAFFKRNENPLPCVTVLFLCSGTNLWKPVGARAVFGGQIIGQAMAAAAKTKPSDVSVHSIHCYFLRPGMYGISTFSYKLIFKMQTLCE